MTRKPDLFEIVLGVLILGGLAYFFFAGGKPSGAGVALINLDRVAGESGRGMTIKQTLDAEQARLRSELSSLQATLEDGVAKKKTEFGENPTEEQQKILQDLEKEILVKFRQEELQRNQDLNILKQKLVGDFQNEVRPIAAKIAAENGALVVLISNAGTVLSADESVDVTDEVITELQVIPSTSP